MSLDCIIFGLQRVGGVSTYWYEMCRWLAARDDVDLELVLPNHMRSIHQNAVLGLAASHRRGRLPDRLARYRPVQASAADIFHSSYYRTAGQATRRVVTVYDFIYERHRRGPARWVHAGQKARSVAAADAVICISNSCRADLLTAYPAVDPARVHAIPLAVDPTQFFLPDDGERRQDLADCALFVGLRGGYKRFDLAVGAIAMHPHLRLAFTGAPPTVAERALLERMLCGRWQWLGELDAAGLRRAYASAWALLYPSDDEGFGLPLIEAMACGLPVAAAGGRALREAGGGAAAYAAEQTPAAHADALAAIAADRGAIVAAGLAHAGGFRWPQVFERTLAVYAAALAQPPVSR